MLFFFFNRVLVSYNLQTSGNIKVLFNFSGYILSRFLFNAFPGPFKCTDFTLKQKYCMYNQPSAALTPALLMILFTEFVGIIMRVHMRVNIY